MGQLYDCMRSIEYTPRKICVQEEHIDFVTIGLYKVNPERIDAVLNLPRSIEGFNDIISQQHSIYFTITEVDGTVTHIERSNFIIRGTVDCIRLLEGEYDRVTLTSGEALYVPTGSNLKAMNGRYIFLYRYNEEGSMIVIKHSR